MNFTPFINIHRGLGAKMHAFAGYEMPIEYSGIIDEHLTVRNAVGVFDVSHMGEIWVKGEHAYSLLQRVTTNDLNDLTIGKVQYSCLPNGNGGVVDDVLVYRFELQKYMVVVNAANTAKVWNWLQQHNTEGALLDNATEWMAQLAVQGPLAKAVLQKLTSIHLASIPYYHFTVGHLAGADNVIISNTGYTGAGGFELYFFPEHAEQIWHAIFEAGKEYGIKPCGLGARDTLRLESGYCLYGNELSDSTSPIEAGLHWITKFTPDNDFIDRAFFESQVKNGVTKKLVRFEMVERGIPRSGYEITDAQGTVIGQVTSGSVLPSTKNGIGMGYIETAYAKKGQPIYIHIRGKDLQAVIIK